MKILLKRDMIDDHTATRLRIEFITYFDHLEEKDRPDIVPIQTIGVSIKELYSKEGESYEQTKKLMANVKDGLGDKEVDSTTL